MANINAADNPAKDLHRIMTKADKPARAIHTLMTDDTVHIQDHLHLHIGKAGMATAGVDRQKGVGSFCEITDNTVEEVSKTWSTNNTVSLCIVH